MKKTAIKAAACAALAAALIGGVILANADRPARAVEAKTVRSSGARTLLARPIESGYCVIPGRPVEDEPGQILPDPEPEPVMVERDLRVDVPLIRGCVPAPNEAQEAQEAPKAYTEEELEIFACAIYQEAGGDKCSDLCRMYVGDVMLNRMDDPRFPNTLYEVLTQKHQYGLFWKTGIIWPGRASDPNEAAAVERAYDTARALLEGKHSELYGAGYIFQDTKPRGKDVIYLDGEYFGR